MNRIVDQTFEEERALYNISDTQVKSCAFKGEFDAVFNSMPEKTGQSKHTPNNFSEFFKKRKSPELARLLHYVGHVRISWTDEDN